MNSPDYIDINLEIRDESGEILQRSSTRDYSGRENFASSPQRTVEIRDFIFQPAKSRRGTLTLRPLRYSASTGEVDLAPIEIGIRLRQGASQVTIFEPKGPEFDEKLNEWFDESSNLPFDPEVQLEPISMSLMKIDRKDVAGATAEAVLRYDPGQGSWHVKHCYVTEHVAHVTLEGDSWAGVSYYLAEVCFSIRKSLLNLPGIKAVVWDQP